jgi:hypothetical protein
MMVLPDTDAVPNHVAPAMQRTCAAEARGPHSTRMTHTGSRAQSRLAPCRNGVILTTSC